MTAPPGVVSDFRLVMYETLHGVVGSLYAVDANPYSEPLFSFPLQPDQELPKLPPGGLVRAEGTVGVGCTPTMLAEGVEIAPAAPLVAGTLPPISSRLFAERGSVVCHPAITGWKANWRYSPFTSVSPLADWEGRIKRDVKIAWALFGLAVIFVLVAIWTVVNTGNTRPVGSLLAFIAGLTTTLVSLRLARRSRRALAQARTFANSPARPLRMQLWWSAGYGHGPMAVASLFDNNDALVSHVSVVNIPVGFAPVGLVPVEVVGDPRGAPIIRCGTAELWPAEFAHDLLHVRDGSQGRTFRDGLHSIVGLRPKT